VETQGDLQEVYARLQQADRPVLEEGATTCCYAKSEKSWIADPQGLSWETFLTSGESTVYGVASISARSAPRSALAAPQKRCKGPAAMRSRNSRPTHPAADKERVHDTSTFQRAVSLHRQFGTQHFGGVPAQSKGAIHPCALKLLHSLELPTEGLRSKSWNEFAEPSAPVMDFVFTVCDQAAGEVCPMWPVQPITAHWGTPDPAAVDGSDVEQWQAFRDTFRALENRIKVFTSLPLCLARPPLASSACCSNNLIDGVLSSTRAPISGVISRTAMAVSFGCTYGASAHAAAN
jgi:arsenate reductase (thioredoxin)